jgi:amino acid permease
MQFNLSHTSTWTLYRICERPIAKRVRVKNQDEKTLKFDAPLYIVGVSPSLAFFFLCCFFENSPIVNTPPSFSSCLVLSCPALSCPIISYPIHIHILSISCLIPYPVLSCPVLSCKYISPNIYPYIEKTNLI